jgi:flagellar M-ring protein FliF
VPPAPEKLKSIRELVTAATGFVNDRDQIVVETLPFETTLNVEPPAPPPSPVKQTAPQNVPGWLARLPIPQKLLLPVTAGAAVVLLLLIAGFFLLLRKRRVRGQVEARKALEKAAADKLLQQPPAESIENKIAERENQKRRLEAEALNALKLPPVATKKTEILTKHLRETIKKDPSVAGHVLLGWMREGES